MKVKVEFTTEVTDSVQLMQFHEKVIQLARQLRLEAIVTSGGYRITAQGEVLRAEKPADRERFDNVSIHELELSGRTHNCLARAEIRTLGKLVQCKEAELDRIPNMGPKSIDEIKQALAERGLQLREKSVLPRGLL